MFQRVKSFLKRKTFNSREYWESRYAAGGNSGRGSYGRLADFKAEVLNKFVADNGIRSVIEFGCGDGNQLSMAAYPKYIGLDVSGTVIRNCIERFGADKTKSFFLYDASCFLDNGQVFACDISMSIDVLYHLIEQEVYETYLQHLFLCSKNYVAIYAPNVDLPRKSPTSHEYYRKFSNDVARLAPDWELVSVIENAYKPKDMHEEECSIADFYFYRRKK
jgi:hypothetical protein